MRLGTAFSIEELAWVVRTCCAIRSALWNPTLLLNSAASY